MSRWIALLFLGLVAFYVAATPLDHCHEGPQEHAIAHHVFCSDDCAVAPLPTPPAAPPSDPLPKLSFEEAPTQTLPSPEHEPDTTPPRL